MRRFAVSGSWLRASCSILMNNRPWFLSNLPMMLHPFPLIASLACASLCLGVDSPKPGRLRPEEVLKVLTKLPLPDTRNATWVHAELSRTSCPALLPGLPEGDYSGNAWLVKESSDGVVELIVRHGRRIRGRRAAEPAFRPGGTSAPPPMEISIVPADLD